MVRNFAHALLDLPPHHLFGPLAHAVVALLGSGKVGVVLDGMGPVLVLICRTRRKSFVEVGREDVRLFSHLS